MGRFVELISLYNVNGQRIASPIAVNVENVTYLESSLYVPGSQVRDENVTILTLARDQTLCIRGTVEDVIARLERQAGRPQRNGFASSEVMDGGADYEPVTEK